MARPSRIARVFWTEAVLLATLLAAVLCATSCAGEVAAQPAKVEEIRFRTGEFELVGDLRLPAGQPPFPLVIFVNGDGEVDRYSGGALLPVFERVGQAGYAVLTWDKPGAGESTGMLKEGHVFEQRAQILLQAIQVMKARTDIDAKSIGLAGVSQAGYVMPRALMDTKDAAFMICVSCPGNATADQSTYLAVRQRLCGGVTKGNEDRRGLLLAELERTRTYNTYEEYVAYRQVLSGLADITESKVWWKGFPTASRAQWEQAGPDNELWWNPMTVVAELKMPILAFFGSKDTQVDAVQGAGAYQNALRMGGNASSRVVTIDGVSHGMIVAKSGCMDELAGKAWSEITISPKFMDELVEWLTELKTPGGSS